MDQNAFSPPARRSLVDDLVDLLAGAIADGRFPPGSTLPPERDLAAELGVTRTSLRQAIARLAQVGLLASRQGSGTRVLELASVTDPAVAGRLLGRDGDLLNDLLEVRTALVSLIVRRATARATADDIARLESLVGDVRTAPDAASCQAAEMCVFSALVDVGANQVLALIMGWTAQLYLGEGAQLFSAAFAEPASIADELDRVVDAVASADAERSDQQAVAYAATSAARLLRAARRAKD